MPKSTSNKKGPSQRQLRVGEELRHALAQVMLRNECSEPELESLSVTISEVRISPDLRNATAYVVPLGGGEHGEEIVDLLEKYAGKLRRAVTSQVHLKYSPQLRFKLDKSFDEAQKISLLLDGTKTAGVGNCSE